VYRLVVSLVAERRRRILPGSSIKAGPQSPHSLIEQFAIFELKLVHCRHDPKDDFLTSIAWHIERDALLRLVIAHLNFNGLTAIVARLNHMCVNFGIDDLTFRIAPNGQAWFTGWGSMDFCCRISRSHSAPGAGKAGEPQRPPRSVWGYFRETTKVPVPM
jgi:hypothetical protein